MESSDRERPEPVVGPPAAVAPVEPAEGYFDNTASAWTNLNLQFFDATHLPPWLAEVSRGFADLAHHLVRTLPAGRMRDMALEDLLRAKDAAVRAKVAIIKELEGAGLRVDTHEGRPVAMLHREDATGAITDLRCLRCAGHMTKPTDMLQRLTACGECGERHEIVSGVLWIGTAVLKG